MRTDVGGRVVGMFCGRKMRANFHCPVCRILLLCQGILFDTDTVDNHSLPPPTA